MSEVVLKTKSISRIEDKLQELEEESYRYKVLETCRDFKTSWIQLGQMLFSVHRDHLYEEWGYSTFESYCSRELSIRNNTALKLLRSYNFLESEEPQFLKKSNQACLSGEKHPHLDSVHLLRLAKNNKKIGKGEYQKIRTHVLDDAKEPQDIRKEVRMMSERMDNRSPNEIRAERRVAYLKKLLKSLENAKLESMANRFLPPKVIDDLDALSQDIESVLNKSL